MSMPSQDFNQRQSWGILLLRVLVGWVFLSEGIQKFLFPASLGAGRFLKIGIVAPQFTGPFVGVVEIVCGTMLIVGFFTVLATLPFSLTSLSLLPQLSSTSSPNRGSGQRCMMGERISVCCSV
jgi:uncharacterized membrane protein YphA (DoxX/SURF4 family)